jgi:hypothetical protein
MILTSLLSHSGPLPHSAYGVSAPCYHVFCSQQIDNTGETVRQNITETQLGIPMTVEIDFFDIETCDPIQVWVDSWVRKINQYSQRPFLDITITNSMPTRLATILATSPRLVQRLWAAVALVEAAVEAVLRPVDL